MAESGSNSTSMQLRLYVDWVVNKECEIYVEPVIDETPAHNAQLIHLRVVQVDGHLFKADAASKMMFERHEICSALLNLCKRRKETIAFTYLPTINPQQVRFIPLKSQILRGEIIVSFMLAAPGVVE